MHVLVVVKVVGELEQVVDFLFLLFFLLLLSHCPCRLLARFFRSLGALLAFQFLFTDLVSSFRILLLFKLHFRRLVRDSWILELIVFVFHQEILVLFHLFNLFPLSLCLLLKFQHSLLFSSLDYLVVLPLDLFLDFKILKKLLMPIKGALEQVFLLQTLRKHSGARIPTKWVHSFRINSASKGSWSSRIGSSLLPKFVRSVAEHDSFVIANGGFGESIECRLVVHF